MISHYKEVNKSHSQNQINSHSHTLKPTFPVPIHTYPKSNNCSISQHFQFPFPQIQIHGPVCLSENVDCIVVNDRHSSDPAMRELLDQFVDRNKCNLIWMEPGGRIDYPSFTHAPAHLASLAPPHPPLYAPPIIPPAGTWLHSMAGLHPLTNVQVCVDVTIKHCYIHVMQLFPLQEDDANENEEDDHVTGINISISTFTYSALINTTNKALLTK